MHFVGILITFLLGTALSSSVNGYYHPSPRFFGSILSGTSSLSTAIRNKVTLTKRIKDILDDLEDLENDFEKDLENLKEDFEEDLERLERRIDGDLDELKEDLQKEFEEDLEDLKDELTQLIADEITALREELTPTCPTIGLTESKEIDGSCYILYDEEKSATDAVNDCFEKGGKLAEPTDITAVYNGLTTNFATEITTITGRSPSDIFLGAIFNSGGTAYEYIQSGASIAGSGTTGNYLTLLADGGTLSEQAATGAPFAYLCEFTK